jgi:large subunit ribosomal protein L21
MVELNDVLLIAGNGDVRVGRPRLEGARVIAEVVEHGRDRKIIVFKYKSKTRYRRRRGHRQGYTRLAVRQILTAEGPLKAEEKPKRRRVAKAEAKAEAEAKPARRTRARKAKPEAETAEGPPKAEEKPKRRRVAKTEAEAEAKPARRTRARKPEPEAETVAPVEAPEADAKPARRTRARKPAAEGAAKKTGKEKPKSGE